MENTNDIFSEEALKMREEKMINNIKVILIGGSPMSGKTTLATKLSSNFGYSHISTDDIGEILQSITDISPMRGVDYREYYILKSEKELQEETYLYHQQIFPAIKRLIEIHSEWGNPIIIEGWALYPSLLKWYKEKVKKIWLISEEELLRERLIKSESFYKGASDQNEMISKYLNRSIWHNKKLLNELLENNEEYITNTRTINEDELLEKTIKLLKK